MSFLDNLENNLKSLESRDELDPETVRRESAAKLDARTIAIRTAPHAAALKDSAFTSSLLTAARTIGHSMRTMVRFTWLESTLRLEAKERKLELEPTPDGIVARFFEDGIERHAEPLDLKGSGEQLARRWLTGDLD
ncbi:MAG: hypothetical protein JST16_01885 [Bdellovibrionales bacterium]|nr:hypothetical protein [Bdellovibrionales bacterium]